MTNKSIGSMQHTNENPANQFNTKITLKVMKRKIHNLHKYIAKRINIYGNTT